MKKLLLTSACLIGIGAGQIANAIPALQLYVEGGTYDATTETWVGDFSSGSLRLWAIGNVSGEGGKGTIRNVKLAIAYDAAYTPSFTLTPSTTGSYGGFTDPSTPSAPPWLQTGIGTTPQLSDGRALPSHGVYGAGTDWQEYALGDFSVADSPSGDFMTVAPSPSGNNKFQINVYEIQISGVDAVHFDLYDNIVAGNKTKATFAPFSHDGGATAVPDGGTTAVLMGIGMLGLGFFARRES